jgi:hypothetical protein
MNREKQIAQAEPLKALAKEHRRAHHPEIKPVRRRRGSLTRYAISDDQYRAEGLENARKVAASLARLEETA